MYKKRLAEIINALGFVYFKRLDYAEAFRCFEEVQQICQSLLSEIGEGPKPVKLLDLLATRPVQHGVNSRGEQAVRQGPSNRLRSRLSTARRLWRPIRR